MSLSLENFRHTFELNRSVQRCSKIYCAADVFIRAQNKGFTICYKNIVVTVKTRGVERVGGEQSDQRWVKLALSFIDSIQIIEQGLCLFMPYVFNLSK